MRKSIVEVIERQPAFRICGEAETADEAFAAILSLEPDVVLTDIQLKSSNGLDLIKQLREHAPAVAVVATTMFDVGRNERLARAAGAVGFVAKQDGPDKLISTLYDATQSNKGKENI